jgi:hypothetical protein
VTLETLFLVVVPVYLVLIAYGQVGSRKRKVPLRTRWTIAAIRILLVPAALYGALWSTGDPYYATHWWPVLLAMAAAGAIAAALVELVAPRVGA